MSSMYTLMFSTVNCFTLCSFIQYTSNSVYVFTEHTVQYVFQNALCYTGKVVTRNRIGQRATTDVPGQHGGNVTMCAAILDNGVLTHIPLLGPYNTQQSADFFRHSLEGHSP